MNNNSIINALKAGMLTITSATIATIATLYYRRKHSIPKKAEPISPFSMDDYLGKWYEIARIDHRWERNLSNTTAEYDLDEKGQIVVTNRGYNFVKNKWEESKGVVQFIDNPNTGALEVSYFGPFFSGYNVVAVEGDYDYALVVGRGPRYCWILSRTPYIPEGVRARFILEAMRIGVDVDALNWIDHDDETQEA